MSRASWSVLALWCGVHTHTYAADWGLKLDDDAGATAVRGSPDVATPSTANYSVRWTTLTQPIDNSTGIPRACGPNNAARCSRDSMPLGSGRAAVNVWVDTHGLAFYLRDGRALDEYHALHTLGMIQLKLTPNPFASRNLRDIEQHLDHERAVLTVRANSSDGLNVVLQLFVDRLQHVVRIRAQSSRPVDLAASLFLWRRDATFAPASYQVKTAWCGDCGEGYTHGDTVSRFDGSSLQQRDHVGAGVTWQWRANQSQSVFTRSIEQQRLPIAVESQIPTDPLSRLSAGGVIVSVKGPLRTIQPAAGVVVNTTRAGTYGLLSSTTAARSFELLVVPHVNPGSSGKSYNFKTELRAAVADALKFDYDTALAEHVDAWARLWQRSWILVPGGRGSEQYNVTQMAVLGRYLDLSQGSGPYPIKWQGGLFHYDSPPTTNTIDEHGWGGAYWIWETRYPYYATTAAGDFDMTAVWLRMFRDQLPLARARVRQIYGHSGAIFVETTYLWGAPLLSNFAEHCNRTLPAPDGDCRLVGQPGVPIDSSCDVENPYIKHFFSGSLEVCVMALRQYEHTQNGLRDGRSLLELSDDVLMFYREHWRWATVNGTMHLFNSSGCESWPRCDDPAPEIAGLTVLLEGLLALPADVADQSVLGYQAWRQMLKSLPPLPLIGDGSRGIAPCRASHAPQIEGGEGVGMYPIWPFQMFGAAQTSAQAKHFPKSLGLASWHNSGTPQMNTIPGQHNSAPMVQAAALGLATEARSALVWEHQQRPLSQNRGFNESHAGNVPRFAGFWGTFAGLNCSTNPYGTVPATEMCTFGDTDPYPGTAAKHRIALQLMLMQAAAPANAETVEGRRIVLFPGWPRAWGDVWFKLNAPLNTTVECELKDGKVVNLVVTPTSRRVDIVIAPLQNHSRLIIKADDSDITVLSPLLDSAYAAPLSTAVDAMRQQGKTVLYVNCTSGSDINSGTSPEAALRTLPKAVSLRPSAIHISGGMCPLTKKLLIDQPVVLRGDGKTALSGGQSITGWRTSPRHPGSNVMVAKVSGFPLAEIKMLRLGPISLRRARWPKLVGDGLTTPNWLFTMPWSSGAVAPNRSRGVHRLGINPTMLPPHVNLSAIAGSGFVHVLGCVERDVNSQLTKVLSIGGNATQPFARIMFRNEFSTNQRYYFENVDWQLEEGEFVHDETNDLLYAFPPSAQARLLKSDGAVAPVTDQLLEIRGENTVVSNLTFLDTTFYADGYWDGPGQQPSDAAVRVNYAKNVTIEACNFLSSIGGYGVAIGNRTTNSRVLGCLIEHVGQGGVFMYGYDHDPNTHANGAVPGNNTQPTYIEVAHNVISDIGQNLVHVAGVGLRSASHCHIHHNRISGSPRYGLQADSFFTGESGGPADNSRFNLLEFNIITDTCTKTSDCGAIEMLGSGDSNQDGPPPGWNTANTVRWNNISDTQGSSSSDGKTVCVHGMPDGPWCRRLVWGVYLDGGQAGCTIFGNVIGATLHGAVLDNAGGNNTHENNIFVGDAKSSTILVDFGTAGGAAPRSVAGSVVKRNIFAFSNPHASMMASQIGSPAGRLKPNGSDFNLFWSSVVDASSVKAFPGEQNLSQWSGRAKSMSGPIACENTPGQAGLMVVSSECSWSFDRNSTTDQYVARQFHKSWRDSYVIHLDCEGSWTNCDQGTANTRICLSHYNGDWSPITGKYPGQVQNSAWNYSAMTGALRSMPNGRCVEVCLRKGAVAGCDGGAGSVVQLRPCTGEPKQKWEYHTDGTFRSRLGTNKAPLCLANPSRAAPDFFDRGSIVTDPLFVDAVAGNFNLRKGSPALVKLGFRPIPPIQAPTARCADMASSCGLTDFMPAHV